MKFFWAALILVAGMAVVFGFICLAFGLESHLDKYPRIKKVFETATKIVMYITGVFMLVSLLLFFYFRILQWLG